MSAKKGVFNLRISSAQADVPGTVSAVGQACYGKFYFAFSPRTGAGILVLSPKKGDPTVWRTTKGEAPHKAPDQAMPPKDIVAAYNAVRASGTVERGEPAWYRGSWAGTLACNEGAPVVTLTRKVASYALLSIVSTPTGHWKVTATTRPDKWFTSTKRDAQTREDVVKGSLSEAMEHGYRLASASVAIACSTRDTTRRTALDAEFAKAHPAKPAKPAKAPKKDPIEEVAKAKPTAAPNRASSPSRRQAPKAVDLPQLPAPKGQAAASKAAAQLAADAKALGDGKGVTVDTMVKRAAKLLAAADALVRSDACTGDAADQANAALGKARAAFDRAAAAVESDVGVAKNLATVAQQTALVAARAGKACAGKANPVRVPRGPTEPPGLAPFMKVYAEELARAVRERPADYAYGPDEVDGVVAKIRTAIQSGSYNKDGRGFAQTCKRLGIPFTYKAIAAYVSEPHPDPAPAATSGGKRRASQAKTPVLNEGKQQKLGALFANAIREAAQEMSA